MTHKIDKTKQIRSFKEVLEAYFETTPSYACEYGNGHINDTFLIECGKRYILQRMNTTVFLHPVELMENIYGVTEYIRNYLKENNNSKICTLTIVPTLDGRAFYIDSLGNFWRLYDFVEGSVTYEKVREPEDFYKCAVAFGNFQRLLSDYPVEKLNLTIINLHNTPWRYEKLFEAAANNLIKRADHIKDELDFVRARKDVCDILEKAHTEGRLPLRVTHNDTKLNNILFDEITSEPLCVIDLDTVMPGYSVTDFGDSIRFGANTANEDEINVSKVSLDLELFREYARGFIQGCADILTEDEVKLLPYGALVITLECGIRFLTDYLNGDVYFKIHRPKHNLERARCQFALVRDMENKLESMIKMVDELYTSFKNNE
jgi:hypothetical protein